MAADVLHLVQVELEQDTADDVLKRSMGICECVAVFGYRPDGTLFVDGTECVAETLLLMERAKSVLIE